MKYMEEQMDLCTLDLCTLQDWSTLSIASLPAMILQLTTVYSQLYPSFELDDCLNVSVLSL